MSSALVWYRFEAKRKDGSLLKLRIQDLPAARISDAVDMMVNYFIKDEPVNRAVGIANNPKSVAGRKQLYTEHLPLYHTVICCSDDTNDVKEIMGLSTMYFSTHITAWLEKLMSEENKRQLTKEEKTYFDIYREYTMKYNPVKEFNLDTYYIDRGLLVLPNYRGLGIAEIFFKVRRMICEAHGVPITGGWMTGFGTQIAAARDGWQTVSEIEYDYLAKKYAVTFTDVPPTMKFMLIKLNSVSTK